MFDAAVLFELLFKHMDGTAAGRMAAAIVLVLAVIGSWGAFAGAADANLPDAG